MDIAIIAFLIFLFLGMPIAFAIGISGLVFFFVTPDLPLTIVVQKTLSVTQSFTMLAIPLFIFAGNLMNNTGITSRLIRLANVLTRHMYGNIAQVSVVLSTLMGGVSGSAVADAAMECRVLGPEMTKQGYNKGYSAAINGVSGLIVATIPPSMGLIIYGSVGEVSIGRLFTAGFVPGIMMMIALMIAVSISARKRGYLPQNPQPATAKEVFKAVIDSIWAIMFPFLLIIFIRFGIMTPSESGAFATAYAIFVGVFIYRELTFKVFWQTVHSSIRDISVITLILAFSGVFGYGIVYDKIPQALAAFLVGVTTNPLLMLFIIILFLILAGMFVETTVCALLLTPILLPVVTSVGVDPVHFGIIMMTIVTMGVMTPPVGIALYSTSALMGCPPEETVKQSGPFFAAILVVVAIVTLFPEIVLYLPNLVFGVR